MKYKIILFSVVALLIFSASGFMIEKKTLIKQAPINTLEELGPALIEILKKNDSVAYFNLFINEKELPEILAVSSFSTEKKMSITKKMKENPFNGEAYKTFRQIQNSLKESLIDWNSFSFERSELKQQKQNNLLSGRLEYEFKCGDKTFSFRVKELVKTSNGWKLSNNIILETPDNEYKMAREMATRDSIAADSIMKEDYRMMMEQMEAQRLVDSITMVMEADSARHAQEILNNKKKKKGK